MFFVIVFLILIVFEDLGWGLLVLFLKLFLRIWCALKLLLFYECSFSCIFRVFHNKKQFLKAVTKHALEFLTRLFIIQKHLILLLSSGNM